MESSRFDAWVRSWAAPSRRGIVRLLAGAGVAAISARFGSDEAAAKCVKPGKKCKKKNGKKKKCCGGAKCKGKKCKCQDGTFACGKNCCIPGQLCENGSTCSNGSIPIGGNCNPDEPGACTEGVCGCNGPLCICRESDCVGPGETCASNFACCQGVCHTVPLTCSLP